MQSIWDVVKSDDASHLRTLLAARADVQVTTQPFGLTLMHVAVGHGCLNAAQVLLDAGVSVNVEAQDGEAPLHMAAHENCQTAVQWLVKHRADINTTNDDGETPLHSAMQSLRSKAKLGHIIALLEAKADTSARDSDGRSAIEHARLFSDGNSDELLSLLQRNGQCAEEVANISPCLDAANDHAVKDNFINGGTSSPKARSERCERSDQDTQFDIGAKVRIRCNSFSRRATVACVLGDSKIEVVFDDDDSESIVSERDVTHLQDFEKQPPACEDGDRLVVEVGRCREEGNTLFRLKDAAAAAERYSIAIDTLGFAEQAASSNVIAMVEGAIWLGNGTWKPGEDIGMVRFLRSVDKSHPFSRKLPEARKVLRNKVLAVQSEPLADTQVALYLNRARCWLSLGAYPRALRDCELASALRRASRTPETHWFAQNWHKLVWPILISSLAFAVSQTNWAACVALVLAVGVALLGLLMNTRITAHEKGDARLCTACFLRARARLNQGRLKHAEAELQRAGALAPGPSQITELHQLKREIVEARRGNRRLAKEVAKWCEAAMAKAKPDAFASVAAE